MSTDKQQTLLYKARDNSGFVIYDTFSGETKFIKTEEELTQLQAASNNNFFTVSTQ